MQSDCRVTYTELEEAFTLSAGTVNMIVNNDLGLVKKSARWVPKLLSSDQKIARLNNSRDFCQRIVTDAGLLDRIVTMDESAVSFHTPETKQQSKQWLPKVTPGLMKARVHASRRKQMILAFFDNQGMIYTNYVTPGSTVNADYIVDVLGRFLKSFKLRQPEKATGCWILHWDNAPVHTAAKTKKFLVEKGIKTLVHAPYSPDLAPADFFLFPTVKLALSGISIDGTMVKAAWERVIETTSKEDFARAYQKWHDRHMKCVRLQGDYVENFLRKNI